MERDYEEDLRARFDELLIEDLIARASDDHVRLYHFFE